MTKKQLEYTFIALSYALRNPSKTFKTLFYRPSVVVATWFEQSQGMYEVSPLNFKKIIPVLEKMGDEESKVNYIRELAFLAMCCVPYVRQSSMPEEFNTTINSSEWNKRKLLVEDAKLDSIEGIENDDFLKISQIFPQYEYKNIFQIDKNDIVFDCGGFVGDTALLFEKKLSENGKVYSFEPTPTICEVFNRNMEKFGQGNIELVNAAVSNVTGRTNLGGIDVEAITLDEFCLKRTEVIIPTFIKMDIEGAELLALEGAKDIISKYTPKLAICTYHKIAHFWEVPELILQYSDKYTFYFNKHHPKADAVLYALPRR